MSRLEIALMVAVLLLIGLVQQPIRATGIHCNIADDPIQCLLTSMGEH